LAAETMPASATMVTSLSRYAALNASVVGSMIFPRLECPTSCVPAARLLS
jgi:hypothetical protein